MTKNNIFARPSSMIQTVPMQIKTVGVGGFFGFKTYKSRSGKS